MVLLSDPPFPLPPFPLHSLSRLNINNPTRAEQAGAFESSISQLTKLLAGIKINHTFCYKTLFYLVLGYFLFQHGLHDVDSLKTK